MYNLFMKYNVPGVGEISINSIILDLNGTLSVGGVVSTRTKELISEITAKGIEVVLFTGDQRGTANKICLELGITLQKCENSKEKALASKKFNKATTAAIGNARIDIGTFKNSIISVATLQGEGIHTGILKYVDVIVPSIENALELFLDTDSFSSTMRR